MIRIACVSCQSAYDLDERRLPPTGQKMRCPKCSASFRVFPDGKTEVAPGNPAPPAGAPSVAAPPKVGPPAQPSVAPRPKGPPPPPPTVGRPAPPFPPGPAPQKAAPRGALDLDLPDLPSPKRQVAAPAPSIELDLPMARSELDLPARAAPRPVPAAAKQVEARRSASPQEEVDLPQAVAMGVVGSPKPATGSQGSGSRSSEAPFDLDWPTLDSIPPSMPPSGAPAAPSTPSSLDRFGDLELDLPGLPGEVDLPQVSSNADLPAVSFGLDLPRVSPGADLPAVSRNVDLPGVSRNVDLPGVSRNVDLPMVSNHSNLPGLVGGGASDSGLPPLPELDLPRISDAPGAARGFGEIDLGIPGGAESTVGGFLEPNAATSVLSERGRSRAAGPRPSFDAGDLPPTLLGSMDPPGRQSHRVEPASAAAGGAGYGEVALEAGPEDSMEFADIPTESFGGNAPPDVAVPRESLRPSLQPPHAGQSSTASKQRDAAKKKSARPLVFVVAGVGLLLVVGLALGATPFGVFGVYALERLLPSAGDPAKVAGTIKDAEGFAAQDTYTGVRRALAVLANGRREAGLNRELLARSLMHEALYQQRFGADVLSEGHAAAILSRIEERGGSAPGIELGRAAFALHRGDTSAAARYLATARSLAPKDAYVHLVAGELALEIGKAAEAVRAFSEASRYRTSGARALWGLARARLLEAEDPQAAEFAVDATLAESPAHAAALVAKAQFERQRGNADKALTYAFQAIGAKTIGESPARKAVPSRDERGAALTLMAQIYEVRGDWERARTAYEGALSADPDRGWALVGAGRALLRELRYGEALARFDAVLTRRPTTTTKLEDLGLSPTHAANLGAAQAMLALGRVQQATATLQDLVREHPDDAEVLLWLGRAETLAEQPVGAEKHLREAVRLAPKSFDAYLALAELQFKQSKPAEAVATLEIARREVRETTEMREKLGALEASRGNLDAAEREFRRSLALDSNNRAAAFGLGATLRRAGKLDEAAATFDKLALSDQGFPGLAVERGALFEAQGKAAEAVRSYKKALEGRPSDLDLRLRLGAAELSAGQLDDAEKTLKEVLKAEPGSAEGEHFLGRVALARGNTEVAAEHLARSIDLDTGRAEFRAYFAWALLEKGSLARAIEQVDAALERDPTVAEAYWVRGRIRLRTGAVQDALRDFEHTLKLNPRRYEAFAAIGDSYDQLRKLPQAIDAYKKALDHGDRNAEWWYRLGRLQLDVNAQKEALHSLSRAIDLAGDTKKIAWLPDAHRIYAEGLKRGGNRVDAIAHYKKYLEIAPITSVDRDDVKRQLAELEGAQ